MYIGPLICNVDLGSLLLIPKNPCFVNTKLLESCCGSLLLASKLLNVLINRLGVFIRIESFISFAFFDMSN